MDHDAKTGQESVQDAEERRQQKLGALKGSQPSTSVSSSFRPTLPGPAFSKLDCHTDPSQKSAKGLRYSKPLTSLSSSFRPRLHKHLVPRSLLSRSQPLPAPQHLPPSQTALKDALRNALARGLPQEVYNEVASFGIVVDEFLRNSMCSTLDKSEMYLDFQNVLYYATTSGLMATTKWLLGHPRVVEVGYGVFADVMCKSNRAVVELLLEHQPNILQNYGAETLRAAVIQGNRAVVELLLEHRPDILQNYGAEILRPAVTQGNRAVVELLLEHRPDILQKHGTRILMLAAVKDKEDIIRLLLENGVDVNAHGGLYTTALHKAVEMGRLGLVEFLLQSGADPSLKDGREGTPRDLAKRFGYSTIKGRLLQAEATWVDQGTTRDVMPAKRSSPSGNSTKLKESTKKWTKTSIITHGQDASDSREPTQDDEVEHEGLSEAIEPSNPPSTDATDSMEDEAEGRNFSAAIDLEMRHILEVLMTKFYDIYINWGSETHGGGKSSVQSQQKVSSSRNSFQPSPSCGGASRTSNGRLGRGKRLAQDQNSDDEDGDEDGKKRPKRQKDCKKEEIAPLFACPYYKRDPAANCKHGSCIGPGFKSVSRVKEHLYRCHISPPQCPRCGESFNEQEELDSHARNDIQCELGKVIAFEGIGPRKLKLLKRKKKNEDDPGEEGRWRDVFRILFPGAPIPTPCESNILPAESFASRTNLDRDFELPSQVSESPQFRVNREWQAESFQNFSNAHLPGLVENRLIDIIRLRLNQLVEEELKNSLPDIIKSAVSDLFQAWERSKSSTPTKPGIAPSETMLPSKRPPTETIPNVERHTSFADDAASASLPASHFNDAFESRQTIPNLQEPSNSNFVNAQAYHLPADTLIDTVPQFANLPTMLSTLKGAPDLWPFLSVQSDTSLPRN